MGRPVDHRREPRIPAPWTTRIPDEDLRWFNFAVRSAFLRRIEPPIASGDLALARPDIRVAEDFALSGVGTRAVSLLSRGLGRLEEMPTPAFELPWPTDILAGIAASIPYVEAGTEIETLPRPDTLGLDAPGPGAPGHLGDLHTRLDCPPVLGDIFAEEEIPALHRDDPMLPAGLYPFQRLGATWLLERESAVLADEMGLGKTVQVIAALRVLSHRLRDLRALVICPRSGLPGWMRALGRWAPGLVSASIQARQQDRKAAWKAALSRCHVLVTTYEAIRHDVEELRGRTFDVIVADHAQWIRNPATATALAVRSLGARRRWALTGIAPEGRVQDLAGILAFARPGFMEAGDPAALPPDEVEARVRPLVLCRRREDVGSELPEKVVGTRWLALSEAQRRAYEQTRLGGLARLGDSASAAVEEVLALLRHLRQICNYDPETGESSKIEYLLEYLEEACSGNRKTVVVAHDADTLALIARRIAHYSPLVDTGRMGPEQRAAMEAAFASEDVHRVLLISTEAEWAGLSPTSPRAEGEGLSLGQVADIFYFDRWWMPKIESPPAVDTRQAGNTRTVFITRPLCEGTIEEQVEDLLAQKAIVPAGVADDLTDIPLERVLSEDELFALLGLTPPHHGKAQALPEPEDVSDAQEGSQRPALQPAPLRDAREVTDAQEG
jgi:SNF2 family DNA or RNA helicase